jgi:hypothetical protein
MTLVCTPPMPAPMPSDFRAAYNAAGDWLLTYPDVRPLSVYVGRTSRPGATGVEAQIHLAEEDFRRLYRGRTVTVVARTGRHAIVDCGCDVFAIVGEPAERVETVVVGEGK